MPSRQRPIQADWRLDRAYGALLGLAVGDALGMPTQMISHADVVQRHGVLDGFHPGPDDHPIAAGLPAGHVTDDTDQALILGVLLADGDGQLDPYAFVAALLEWEHRMIISGSADLLGPSTKRALERVAGGEDIATTGRDGTTNGAAMRIAPVGIVRAPVPLADLVDLVAEVSRPTHATGVAIAGAAAVAAAVSVGVEGGSVAAAIAAGCEAAALGNERGHRTARPAEGTTDVAARIRRAVDLVAGTEPRDALQQIDAEVGTSLATEQSVPAAFAIASMFPSSPWDAARHAASLGGDADTIAAMAGAVVGACCGASALPRAAVERLTAVNPGLGIAQLAGRLLALRR